MPWESRGQSRYYYTTHREGAKVIKTYHGCGREAATLARERTLARQDAAAAQALAKEMEPLERLRAEADEQVDLMVEAVLLAAGCHKHKGEWRKRHGRQNSNPH